MAGYLNEGIIGYLPKAKKLLQGKPDAALNVVNLSSAAPCGR